MAKTLIIVDIHDSAMGISAHQHALSKNTLVFAALDFASPELFVTTVINENADVLIFAWRRVFFDLTHKKLTAELLEKFRRRGQIYFVIADHLGLEPKYFKQESSQFHYADGYYTTNQLLFEEYSKLYPSFPPLGIYRDLPNLNDIRKVREKLPMRNPKKIIWVGNSKWGNNYGFVDHKGRGEILNPLINLLQGFDPSIEVKIIDSAFRFVPNKSVLKEIASAGILVQTSQAEGTGLPILEALALGTIPITNRVGIAEEILSERLGPLLIKRDPNAYFEAICEVLKSDFKREDLVDIFEKYAHDSQIPLPLFRGVKESPDFKVSLFKGLEVSIIWKMRFLKPLVKKSLMRIRLRFNRNQRHI